MELSPPVDLSSRFGRFRALAAREEGSGEEHLVILRGEVNGAEEVPVRIHSECVTGDVMSSLRCDCREQLEKALGMIEERGIGIVIYLRQEGRGIGLMNKIRAYSLQDGGCDTQEANRRLGFRADLRDYHAAVAILRGLGTKSVALITDNPEKVEAVAAGGVPVLRRIPLTIPPNPFNAAYLATKQTRLGHLRAAAEGGSGKGSGRSVPGGGS